MASQAPEERHVSEKRGAASDLTERRPAIDTDELFSFDASLVKIGLALFCVALIGCAAEAPKPYQVRNPGPLPLALNKNFEFRKSKEYFLDPMAPRVTAQTDASV